MKPAGRASIHGMPPIGTVYAGGDESALRIALFISSALLAAGLWLLIRWFATAPRTPEPWDDAVAATIENEDTAPLCHRCLTPHHATLDFCQECGAPVGVYTNLLPFPYLFSIGHTLRIGTSGEFRRTPVTVLGFVFLALWQYAIFAPVYLFMFFKRIAGEVSTTPTHSPSTES